MENLITCNICKKQKKLNEQKSLYYEGLESEMAKKLICEECFPKILSEIENESKNVKYTIPLIIGFIVTIITSAAFYPMYSWIMSSSSMFNIFFAVACLPGFVIFAAMYFSSGRKRTGVFALALLLYLILSFVIITGMYSLNSILYYSTKSGYNISLKQLIEYIIKNPISDVAASVVEVFLANIKAPFSIIMMVLYALPLFSYVKRTLHKII